jgi:transcriptional regulator with XRE-family HTH domain
VFQPDRLRKRYEMKTQTYNLPNCLRKYRKERGLSQKEVARIFDIKSTAMISRWEKRRRPPRVLITVFNFSALYRTSVDALFIDLLRASRNRILKREEKVLRKTEDIKSKLCLKKKN